VHSTSRVLSLVVVFALAGGPLSSAPALAQDTTTAQTAPARTIAQSTSAQVSITGTITNGNGQPLGNATVTATGPATITVRTDAHGAFTITAPPGLYTLVVSHGGYNTASTEIATTSGETTRANVSLSEASLSNLSTIGRTSTSYNNVGTRFNISSSAQTTLSSAAIQERDTPALTTLLQEMPGITASQSATNVNNNFIIHGLGVETKTTIDGHPVSSGVSGTYTGNYTGSGLVGGVDVLYGAGLNGPTAGQAGVGAINIRTPDFTAKDSGAFTTGIDSFGGTMYTALADINFLSNNKLSLIVGKSFSGYRGPSYNKYEDVIDTALNGSVVPQTYTYSAPNLTNADVQGSYDMSDTYRLDDELVKLRYQFSGATSVTAEYLGFYGQFQPQGGAYSQYVGQLTVPQCVNRVSGGGYVGVPAGGTGCTVTSIYNAPSVQNQIGTTQSLYTFYPGSAVRFSQPSFNLDFRTTYKNDTILFRPYTADITRNIDGTGESSFPGNKGGWYEVTNSANCQVAFVGATVANGGAKGPCFLAGSGNGYVPYVVDPNTPHSFNVQGSAPLNCSVAAPCYTTTTQQNNGGFYGYGTPYSTNEYDHLSGYTFSYIHPSGANTYSFNIDHFLDDTRQVLNDTTPLAPGCSYVVSGGPNPPPGTIGNQPNCNLNIGGNPSFPGVAVLPSTDIGTPDTQIYQTDISLTGQFQLRPNLEFDWGNYLTNYKTNVTYEDPAVVQAFLAAYSGIALPKGVTSNPYLNETPIVPVSQLISRSHYDPHFGFVYRPTRDLSIRATAGSSIVVPYSTLISGFTTINQGASGTTITTKNPFLLPEEVVAEDLGMDFRLRGGAIFSGDIWNDVVHNPWLTVRNAIASYPGIIENAGQLYQSSTINGPQEYSEGIQAGITDMPRLGFGYSANMTFMRVFYNDLPASYFAQTTPQSILNGYQVNGNPYAKGYFQIQYAMPHNGLIRLGMDYEGPDNQYNHPAFMFYDATVRTDVAPGWTLSLSGENIFNENFGNTLSRAIEYQGQVPVGYSSIVGYGQGSKLGIIEPPFQTFMLRLSHKF
jgi:hypothetical protein